MARKSRKPAAETPVQRTDVFIHTALYIRLSVEDNHGHGNSLENQKLILEDYIADKPEFKVYDTYIDNGISGRSFDRPDFQRMLSDIDAGNVNCVIVKDLSRLGRNAIDTGYYLEQYFTKKNIRFISVSDGYDTSNPSYINGIMLPLKNMVNEAYALDIGRKIRAQAHQAMLDGDFIGVRAPFGYKKDPNDCHRLIIDEETAPIVRQIFEWSEAGIGVNKISVMLNEMNAVTSSIHKRATTEQDKNYKQSRYWNTFTVTRILDSDVYTGDMVQGKSKVVGRRQIDTNPDEYITVCGTHEPIVSREMFEKSKEIRKAVREQYKEREIDHYTENIFKGKIFCAHCGRPLHRQRAKRKTMADIYLIHCLANDRVAKGTCVGVNIDEKLLISATAEALTEVVNSSVYTVPNSAPLKRRLSKLNAELTVLQLETDKVQTFIQGLYENVVEGVITEEDYYVFKSDYTEKAAALKEDIRAKSAEIKAIDEIFQTRKRIEQSIKKFRRNKVLTAELIQFFVKRIEIDHKGNFRFEFINDTPAEKEVE